MKHSHSFLTYYINFLDRQSNIISKFECRHQDFALIQEVVSSILSKFCVLRFVFFFCFFVFFFVFSVHQWSVLELLFKSCL